MAEKYTPLKDFLKAQSAMRIPMSFAKIESVIKSKLPPAAHKHRPWWSNNSNNNVMTRAWLDAGYRTEQVDMQGKRLVFRRQSVRDARVVKRNFLQDSAVEKAEYASPFYGCMKGMITVSDDCDLTAPADADWDASAGEV